MGGVWAGVGGSGWGRTGPQGARGPQGLYGPPGVQGAPRRPRPSRHNRARSVYYTRLLRRVVSVERPWIHACVGSCERKLG
jgi:hypothetical protein